MSLQYSRSIVSPDYDAYSDSANSAVNFGGSSELRCGYFESGDDKNPDVESYQFLLHVDLTAYIGCAIHSGRLRFKDLGSNFNNSSFVIYRCTRTDWTEFGYTYVNSGSGLWLTHYGGDLGPEGGYQTIGPFTGGVNDLDFNDIGDLIQDVITNRGGILSAAVRWQGSEVDPNYAVVGSTENLGNEPLLEFSYDPPPVVTAVEILQTADADHWKDTLNQCLAVLPVNELSVGWFERHIQRAIARIATANPQHRIPADENAFAAILALDQPRLNLTATDRRVAKFLQQLAQGCPLSTRGPDSCKK